MFNQLLAIVNLGEKLPEAIGWEFVGPYQMSLPVEICEALGGKVKSTFTASSLVIYNYSGLSKSEIRVLYSGKFDFKPKVSYGRRNVSVNWKHDSENNEFLFYDTYPNEKIEIELFDIRQGFSIDQVMVDGKLVTKFMSDRALAQAYPRPKWEKILPVIPSVLCIALFVSIAYTSYAAYKQRQDYELLSQAPFGYLGCAPYIFDNPPGENSKEMLSRKLKKLKPWINFLLAKNKVSSESELYNLDRVVLCNTD